MSKDKSNGLGQKGLGGGKLPAPKRVPSSSGKPNAGQGGGKKIGTKPPKK